MVLIGIDPYPYLNGLKAKYLVETNNNNPNNIYPYIYHYSQYMEK